jgi:hypothetical protein
MKIKLDIWDEYVGVLKDYILEDNFIHFEIVPLVITKKLTVDQSVIKLMEVDLENIIGKVIQIVRTPDGYILLENKGEII